MIYVRDDLKPLFARERSVDDFLAIDGEVVKHVVQTRRTLRFERGGRTFYLKAHWGVGWREIAKNLLTLKQPVLGAGNEWRAIAALRDLGLDTMAVAAYGREGANPARQKSFLVTEAIEDSEDLEHWLPALQRREHNPERVRLRRAVIRRVAEIARQLHTNGINHRDFYLCHLRLDVSRGREPAVDKLRIFVMDLHRAQLRRRTPARWAAKDVAGLLYSALCVSKGFRLRRTDVLRFVSVYSGTHWRLSLRQRRRFWRRVLQRATRACAKDGRPAGSLPGYLAAYQP